jgi:type II secretory pathway component GspD/PulD (secretin)
VKKAYLMVLTVTCIAVMPFAHGQTSESETPASSEVTQGGVPIDQLIVNAAKKTGKRFIVDPRVHANVILIGGSPSDLTYPEFLTVLEAYGYAAVGEGRYVRIVPDANLRAYVTPIITAKDTLPGSEFVTEIIAVKNVSAVQLIPILRPMINQYGHMASYPGTNTLMLSDRFDNVRRVEAIIRAFDAAEPVKPHAGTDNSESHGTDKSSAH